MNFEYVTRGSIKLGIVSFRGTRILALRRSYAEALRDVTSATETQTLVGPISLPRLTKGLVGYRSLGEKRSAKGHTAGDDEEGYLPSR